eukprot:COSAG06_NODE_13381_length_1263_cov_1.283505_2_plen_83_part_00
MKLAKERRTWSRFRLSNCDGIDGGTGRHAQTLPLLQTFANCVTSCVQCCMNAGREFATLSMSMLTNELGGSSPAEMQSPRIR